MAQLDAQEELVRSMQELRREFNALRTFLNEFDAARKCECRYCSNAVERKVKNYKTTFRTYCHFCEPIIQEIASRKRNPDANIGIDSFVFYKGRVYQRVGYNTDWLMPYKSYLERLNGKDNAPLQKFDMVDVNRDELRLATIEELKALLPR